MEGTKEESRDWGPSEKKEGWKKGLPQPCIRALRWWSPQKAQAVHVAPSQAARIPRREQGEGGLRFVLGPSLFHKQEVPGLPPCWCDVWYLSVSSQLHFISTNVTSGLALNFFKVQIFLIRYTRLKPLSKCPQIVPFSSRTRWPQFSAKNHVRQDSMGRWELPFVTSQEWLFLVYHHWLFWK